MRDHYQVKIQRDEMLRYLAYRGSEIDAALERRIQSARECLEQWAEPQVVWRSFDLLPDGSLGGTTVRLTGTDIRRHLGGSERVVLLAVTLGGRVDRLIRTAEARDMTEAVLLDAAASAGIESVLDQVEGDLRTELAGENLLLTARFSPGYGDLPLELQDAICRTLDTQRRIGIGVSGSGIMIPRKSVTAILGISRAGEADSREHAGWPACEICRLQGHCSFRQAGGYCGRFEA